jgi:hypothetical protein
MTTASNAQLYTVAYIYINGSLLAEEASLNVDRVTNSQEVLTVAKGYAGESPGAAMTQVSVDNAVPSADFEFNPGNFMGAMQPVEITVFAANNKLTFTGFIISDNFSHAVNSASKLSFSARGSFANFE